MTALKATTVSDERVRDDHRIGLAQRRQNRSVIPRTGAVIREKPY
jgi:hypothetical protein